MDDKDGNIPGLLWPGEIHRAVQDEIVGNSNGAIIEEVTIRQEDNHIGRIDLVNIVTGEYWEVKPAFPSIDSIVQQLDRYLNPISIIGKEALVDKKKTFSRGESLATGMFLYTGKLGQTFIVEYYQTQPGIIRYVYSKTTALKQTESSPEPKAQKSKNGACLCGGIIIAGGTLFGFFTTQRDR